MRALVAVFLPIAVACGVRPPSDPDAMLAGTYQLTVGPRALLQRGERVTGTLIISGEPSPRGCMFLSGDLRAIGVDDTGSFATNTRWDRSLDGWLEFPVYRGVDYGYRFRLVIRNGAVGGEGWYYGFRGSSSNETSVHGVRIGPPDLPRCYALP